MQNSTNNTSDTKDETIVTRSISATTAEIAPSKNNELEKKVFVITQNDQNAVAESSSLKPTKRQDQKVPHHVSILPAPQDPTTKQSNRKIIISR